MKSTKQISVMAVSGLAAAVAAMIVVRRHTGQKPSADEVKLVEELQYRLKSAYTYPHGSIKDTKLAEILLELFPPGVRSLGGMSSLQLFSLRLDPVKRGTLDPDLAIWVEYMLECIRSEALRENQ